MTSHGKDSHLADKASSRTHDAPASPVSQRLAITLILGDAGLRQSIAAWDAAQWQTPTPLKDVALDRDDTFERVAASLLSQARLAASDH